MGDWDGVNRQGSGRALLGETSNSKRRSRQQPGASAQSGGASPSFRSKWRVSAGVAGVLMFSMALAGLVAIFSTIQRERTPRSASPSQQVQDVSLTPPEAARDDRGEREIRETEKTQIKRDDGKTGRYCCVSPSAQNLGIRYRARQACSERDGCLCPWMLYLSPGFALSASVPKACSNTAKGPADIQQARKCGTIVHSLFSTRGLRRCVREMP